MFTYNRLIVVRYDSAYFTTYHDRVLKDNMTTQRLVNITICSNSERFESYRTNDNTGGLTYTVERPAFNKNKGQPILMLRNI